MKRNELSKKNLALSKSQLIVVAIASILAGLVLYKFITLKDETTGSVSKTTVNQPSTSAFTEGKLEFISSSNAATLATINIAISETEEERNFGLMNRISMPEDAGMLFVFENDSPKSFWMKNTKISLDIIFVSADKKIVNIAENTTPMSEQPIPSTGGSKYVVEVNAGFCKTNRILAGDNIKF